MKKSISFLAIVSMMFFCNLAIASPFLICDPQDGVETYTIYQDGAELAQNIIPEEDGSFKYDLSGMAPGAYEFTAKACNVWGCSNASVPFVSPGGLSTPIDLQMTR